MANSSADSIRESLEQAIIEREFADGDRLDEVRLAARYGVSRTPLREALRLLAGSGLVELIGRRGAYVRYPGVDEVVEMFEVMAEMEALCGRLAARRISPVELTELAAVLSCCEDARQRDDADGYNQQNERFHCLIYTAAGNKFLAAETRKFQRRLRPFRRMYLRTTGRLAQSMKEHSEILKALADGDSERCADGLRCHVAIQAEQFHDFFANQSTATPDRAPVCA